MYNLVTFDLDDTLLRDDLTISSFTLKVLSVLSSRGILIVPASGRAKLSMKPFVDQMDRVSAYISCNGAEIWDGQTHSLLHSETFSPETGRMIAAFGNEFSCYSQTYADDRFFYSEESAWAARYAETSMLKGVYVGDLTRFIREERSKILMMADEEKIASMLRIAQERFKGIASVTCSKPYFLEFNPPAATKGNALKWIAPLLGTETDRAVAFGDSLNDLSMLQTAGLGIAVGNARDDVKTRCVKVCRTNMEDGVAHCLCSIFGIKEDKIL